MKKEYTREMLEAGEAPLSYYVPVDKDGNVLPRYVAEICALQETGVVELDLATKSVMYYPF